MDESILITVRQVVTELLNSRSCIKYSDVKEHPQVKNLQIGDNLLRNTIYKLVEENFITQVQKGSGRRPALYSRSNQNQELNAIVHMANVDVRTEDEDSSATIENNNHLKILRYYGLKMAEIEHEEQEINQKMKELKYQKQILQEKRINLYKDYMSELKKTIVPSKIIEKEEDTDNSSLD
ncbi:hypothetical protein LQF76_01640 [Gloeomargaritales cyanobacterium VI4D9]|nr:hypothetical protein LQF76_01640 [Gloeomargaritales cyanobacterium VI4D9]